VRPGAEIDEIPVAIKRDFLAFRDVGEVADFEFAGLPGRSVRPPRRPLLARAMASSRETAVRWKTLFALISFFISSSIFGKSSGEMRCLRSTS